MPAVYSRFGYDSKSKNLLPRVYTVEKKVSLFIIRGNSNLVTVCYNSFCAFFIADQEYHRDTDQDQGSNHEKSVVVAHQHLLSGH